MPDGKINREIESDANLGLFVSGWLSVRLSVGVCRAVCSFSACLSARFFVSNC